MKEEHQTVTEEREHHQLGVKEEVNDDLFNKDDTLDIKENMYMTGKAIPTRYSPYYGRQVLVLAFAGK